MLKCYVTAGVFLLSGSATAMARSNDQAPVVELSAVNLALSGIALKHFKSRTRAWKCFSASVQEDAKGVVVDFLPSDDIVEDEDSIIINASTCGRGASYTVNRKGKIIDITYSK